MSYQIRSISFPARSHHLKILRIENELSKVQSWQTDHSVSPSSSMAESVCFSLSRLEELNNCMDELLQLPSTQQDLSNHKHGLLMESLLDTSIRLLDVCSGSRDTMQLIKEHVQDMQSTMRRRRSGDLNGLEMSVASYIRYRKRTKKDAKRNMSLLKQIEQDLEASLANISIDPQCSSMITVIRQVILANVSIFESIALFVSAKEVKSKTTRKWSIGTKNILKAGRVVSQHDEHVNEFVALDAELCRIAKGNFTEVGNEIIRSFKDLEMITDGIESSLERVFRSLIKTRASFLNIRSH